jgi:hypothetical protein
MPNVPTASDLRRWAMRCAADAAAAREPADRDRLLRMRDALTSLAENEDWLNGREVIADSDAEVIALAERMTGIPSRSKGQF